MDWVITWVNSFFIVYFIVILARIVLSWVQVAPIMPFWRAVVDFIHDTTNWYLNLFRRFIPAIGPLDLSPIVAIFVLFIVQRLVISLLEAF